MEKPIGVRESTIQFLKEAMHLLESREGWVCEWRNGFAEEGETPTYYYAECYGEIIHMDSFAAAFPSGANYCPYCGDELVFKD